MISIGRAHLEEEGFTMSKSLTINKENKTTLVTRPECGWNQTAATHPGEMLLEELIKPIGLTINGLARKLQITPGRLHDIVHQRRV